MTTVAPTTPTTAAQLDPTFADTPTSRCDTLTPGSIGYRNSSGHVADQYMAIGTSTEGRTIWAEHWGASTGPQVLVLGQVHGDECGPAFLVAAIRQRPPVDIGIWLVPTANPDGLAAFHRHTALDIDPNRDGFDLATPEARAVMHVTELVRPVLTVHTHSPYGWVGAYGGPLATKVATALSEAVGWGHAYNAGTVKNGTQAFLWEGQARVLPGAQSVLIEFPGISPDEAVDAPDPTQVKESTVAVVQADALAMRDALYAVVANDAITPSL